MRIVLGFAFVFTTAACDGPMPPAPDAAAADTALDADVAQVSDVADVVVPADVSATADVADSSCVGGPTPGEKCGPTGWECHMDASNWQSCASFMCAECIGFAGDPSQTVGDCTCTCSEGAVLCKSATDTSCHQHDHISALDAIHIEVTASQCQFTLAQAAAGITIGYDVVIDKDLTGVTPVAQTGCGKPGPSGLIVFEMLGADPNSYCICDAGHCLPYAGTPAALKSGTFSQTFTWDGKSWGGPSDTGTPEGPAFPVGTYPLIISAKGTYTAADGSVTPFEAQTEVDVTLVP